MCGAILGQTETRRLLLQGGIQPLYQLIAPSHVSVTHFRAKDVRFSSFSLRSRWKRVNGEPWQMFDGYLMSTGYLVFASWQMVRSSSSTNNINKPLFIFFATACILKLWHRSCPHSPIMDRVFVRYFHFTFHHRTQKVPVRIMRDLQAYGNRRCW